MVSVRQISSIRTTSINIDYLYTGIKRMRNSIINMFIATAIPYDYALMSPHNRTLKLTKQ